MKKLITYLIASAALMIVSAAAMAQGGLEPFAGSTHEYTITPENTSNALTWSVVEASGYTINSQTIVTTTSVANITWTTAGTYHLQFEEDNGTCITVKEVTVVVGANTFDVSTTDPSVTCNSADGQINYSGSTATTPITFKIDMTTSNPGFSPDWEIAFSLSPGAGATVSNLSSSTGTLSGTGPYTLNGLSSSSGNGTVDITMDVTGDINSILDVDLNITAATDLQYNTPDVDSDDWIATQTINSIPATSAITTD